MSQTGNEISIRKPRRPDILTRHTSFIGRMRELTEGRQLLASARLVTITGVAGCGKTRLALRMVAEVSHCYADGFCWVGLASMAKVALVSQAVARRLRLPERSGKSQLEGLQTALQERQLLLALDNCEHLLPVCAYLAGSSRIVEKHMANILSKLWFTNCAQIVRWGIEARLNQTKALQSYNPLQEAIL